jgi:hypothetical protein
LISKSVNWALVTLETEENPQYFALQALLRKIFWTTALIGLFVTSIFGAMYLTEEKKGSNKHKIEGNKGSTEDSELKIVDVKRYFIYKLILWLGAVPIALALLSLLFFIPIGIPIFSLIYIGFIGSYGILMLLLYNSGKVPGTDGSLSINFSINRDDVNRNSLIAVAASLGFVLLSALFFNSGINYVFPLNNKIIWLIVFTVLTIPGFLVGHKEAALLDRSGYSNKKTSIILWLIGLVPFFIVSIFFAVLGSISGMIGSIHGIIILIFVIVSGNFITKIGEKSIISTLYQSFLIQFLVLTQCALFGIF